MTLTTQVGMVVTTPPLGDTRITGPAMAAPTVAMAAPTVAMAAPTVAMATMGLCGLPITARALVIPLGFSDTGRTVRDIIAGATAVSMDSRTKTRICIALPRGVILRPIGSVHFYCRPETLGPSLPIFLVGGREPLKMQDDSVVPA